MSNIPLETPTTLEPPSPHEVAVQGHIAQLQAMIQSIPGFTFISGNLSRSLASNASVPDEFLAMVAVACDLSPELAAASKITGAELRDVIAFSRAYTTLARELENIARGMRQTVAIRRGPAGRRGLRAYGLSKSLNRAEDHKLMVPHLSQMKTALNRGRRSKQEAVEEAPPAARSAKG